MDNTFADKIHNQLFNEIKETNTRVDKTSEHLAENNGKLDVLISQNETQMKMIWRMFCMVFFLAAISVLAVIYGAIGKEGLHSVRHSVPLTTTNNKYPYPFVNDIQKYLLKLKGCNNG